MVGALAGRPCSAASAGTLTCSRLPCALVSPRQWVAGGARPQRLVATCGTIPGSYNYTAGYPPTKPPVVKDSIDGGVPYSNGGETNGNGHYGPLKPSDYAKFVHFFRQASPYIAGHRSRTFVIVVPGNVTHSRPLLQNVMSDIALLHGLGVRLVVVLGVQDQIDEMLQERNLVPAYVGGYRVTDKDALKIAIEAAGQVRTTCEQMLSKGPAIPMIRRHTKGDGEIHFEPALRVISGNYITAKRRGVVDGVDFGYTGEVRFVLKDDISRQLDNGNVVLLSNLGFTAAGELLNCNTYDVGLNAAVGLGADKLFFYHQDEVTKLNLPQWLPLSDAQDMLLKKVQDSLSQEQVAGVLASLDLGVTNPAASIDPQDANTPSYPASPAFLPVAAARAQANRVASRIATRPREELLVDLDVWTASGFPPAVATCVMACCKGVRRAHLVDARLDGGLLLELYSRDGVVGATMISADFYEGIRRAGPGDLDSIMALLRPLEEAGTLVKRSREEVANLLQDFTVLERETKVLGCALLLPLGPDAQGINVAELGAFCVDPAFRGSGRGDSLLDYVEQDARAKGVERLVLLTTRTADWFEQRDFKWTGPAYASELLPEARRSRINPARNSQLYVKHMEAADSAMIEPGKRIGF